MRKRMRGRTTEKERNSGKKLSDVGCSSGQKKFTVAAATVGSLPEKAK
jgi:hypothetical protein